LCFCGYFARAGFVHLFSSYGGEAKCRLALLWLPPNGRQPQKTADQQARAVLLRARERIVHQRTELVKALRAVLYEYGQVIPQGIGHIKRIEAILDNTEMGAPEIVQEECRDLLAQIGEKTARIEEKARKLAELSRRSGAARRLQTMPGVGPLTALAVEAFEPAMQTFRCGRDFAAWLGLVPRQVSSITRQRRSETSCQMGGNHRSAKRQLPQIHVIWTICTI
jgi:transposase